MKKILMLISFIAIISNTAELNALPLFSGQPAQDPAIVCKDINVGEVCLIYVRNPKISAEATVIPPELKDRQSELNYCRKNENGTFSCHFPTYQEQWCIEKKQNDVCTLPLSGSGPSLGKCTPVNGILTCQ